MNELITRKLASTEQKGVARSVGFVRRVLREYPNDQEILCQAGLLLFQRGAYGEALDALVASYSHRLQTREKKRAILELVLHAYYEPNRMAFESRYVLNVRNFLAYERTFIKSFPPFEKLRFLCIPRSANEFYVFDKHSQDFQDIVFRHGNKRIECRNVNQLDCVMAKDLFDPEELVALHAKTVEGITLYNSKVPVHLIWNLEKTQVFLQLEDYEPVLRTRSFVFWPEDVGEEEILAFFRDDQANLPVKFVGDIPEKIKDVLRKATGIRRQEAALRQAEVERLAAGYTREYYRQLLHHPERLRILFIMRRYTPSVGESVYADDNCIYDSMAACRELGIACDLYTHKSEINWLDHVGSLLGKVAEFRPHILFEVNRSKWEWRVIPDNIMQVVWVIDPVENLPKIYSPECARKVRWNDFFLIMARIFAEDLLKAGFPGSQILHQPIAVNTSAFRKLELSRLEKEHYAADIVYVSNVGNLQGYLRKILSGLLPKFLDPQEQQAITDFIHRVCRSIAVKVERFEPASYVEDFPPLLREAAEFCGIELNPALMWELAYKLGHRVANFLHRTIPLTWLAERGYALKIWGNEWADNEELRDFAMGPVGRRDLPKVFSASKITLEVKPFLALHPRALEAMACGSLYLCKYVPDKNKLDSISNYFVENEDFVFFYDREDLLRKVDYYLQNDEERLRIAENGRRKVVENFSHTRAVQNWLSFIKSSLE